MYIPRRKGARYKTNLFSLLSPWIAPKIASNCLAVRFVLELQEAVAINISTMLAALARWTGLTNNRLVTRDRSKKVTFDFLANMLSILTIFSRKEGRVANDVYN